MSVACGSGCGAWASDWDEEMSMSGADGLAASILEVADYLYGDRKRVVEGDSVRYGSRGSLEVATKRGVWTDHEAQASGGVFDLVVHRGVVSDRAEARRWMVGKGFLVGRAGKRLIEAEVGEECRLGVAGDDPVEYVCTGRHEYRVVGGDVVGWVSRGRHRGTGRTEVRPGYVDAEGIARMGGAKKNERMRGLPYRLPEVLEAVAGGEVLIVVEGEKDADRLAALGFGGVTTNAGGCGKWEAGHTRALGRGEKRGAVIFCDGDEPGMRRMVSVGRSLRHSGGWSVRVVTSEMMGHEVRESGGLDVSDWLDGEEGRGVDGVRGLIDGAVGLDEAIGGLSAEVMEGASKASEGDEVVSAEEMQRYDTTALALARRILRTYGGAVLGVLPAAAAAGESAGDAAVGSALTSGVAGDGVWTNAEPEWLLWLRGVSEQIQAEAEANLTGRNLMKVLAAVAKVKEPSRVAAVRRSVISELWILKRGGECLDVPEARPEQLDADGRYLGCANGVLDLDERRLLSADEARGKLVTMRARAVWRGEGHTHPVVDRLFEHVPDHIRDWTYRVLGYHLRHGPARKFYSIVGPPAGGKSTLAALLMGTLGGYAAKAKEDALDLGRSKGSAGLSPEMLDFLHPHRFAVFSDMSYARKDWLMLKSLSGADAQKARDLHKPLQERAATATIIFLCNSGSVPSFYLRDAAMRSRYVEIPYPAIPEDRRDVGVIAQIQAAMSGDPGGILSAFLAKMVSAIPADENAYPEAPADVTAATERRYEDDLGMLGMFARRFERAEEFLPLSVVWRAWAEECDEFDRDGNPRARVGGMEKQVFSRRLATYFDEGELRVTVAKVKGKVERGFKGWRLLAVESLENGHNGGGADELEIGAPPEPEGPELTPVIEPAAAPAAEPVAVPAAVERYVCGECHAEKPPPEHGDPLRVRVCRAGCGRATLTVLG